MTPPEAPANGTAGAGSRPPAVSVCPADAAAGTDPARLRVLKARAEFLRAARAAKQGTGTMLVQARARRDDDPAIGVGFTCSKKVGNAVTRNRAKRRLRALAREVLPGLGRPGWDYVLIGKPGATAERPYADLRRDLEFALRKLNAPRGGTGGA